MRRAETARRVVRALAAAAAGLAGLASACPPAEDLQRALALINQHRGEGAVCGGQAQPSVPPLSWSAAAADAAAAYAGQLAASRRLAHRDAGGRDGGQRLDEAGLRWSAWAENLARGRIDPQRLVGLWLGSPGHCRNLMLARVSEAGLGCARAADGDDYWALLLWRPRLPSGRSTGPAVPSDPAASPIATTRTPPAATPTPD